VLLGSGGGGGFGRQALGFDGGGTQCYHVVHCHVIDSGAARNRSGRDGSREGHCRAKAIARHVADVLGHVMLHQDPTAGRVCVRWRDLVGWEGHQWSMNFAFHLRARER
jgi:hypothetical protein